jgi:hypothetical protein
MGVTKPVARSVVRPVARSVVAVVVTGIPADPLLDTFPGATVAYSLRKLRSAYTGSAIRVRRSSDNAEQDIGFSGNDFDTAALTSFVGAGDGFVTTWYDQAGSNNATSTTTTQQPLIVSSGSLVVNEFGKPAINFIDSSTGVIGHLLNFSNWYAANQSYVGYFTVYSISTNGLSPHIIGSNPLDRGLVSIHQTSNGLFRTASIRSVVTAANSVAPITLNSTTVRHDVADRVRVKTFVDKNTTAVIDVADSNTNFDMPTTVKIGNANAAAITSNTRMTELIGFTVDQTASELAIRSNQFDFWRS